MSGKERTKKEKEKAGEALGVEDVEVKATAEEVSDWPIEKDLYRVTIDNVGLRARKKQATENATDNVGLRARKKQATEDATVKVQPYRELKLPVPERHETNEETRKANDGNWYTQMDFHQYYGHGRGECLWRDAWGR